PAGNRGSVRHESSRPQVAARGGWKRPPAHERPPSKFEQWQPVEKVAVCPGRGLGCRGAGGTERGAELDGNAGRYGLRTAVDPPSSVLQSRRKTRRLYVRRIRTSPGLRSRALIPRSPCDPPS